MELNKKNDWIGTYDEHLEKLLETHDCLCPKAREILEIIIKDMNDALHESKDDNNVLSDEVQDGN